MAEKTDQPFIFVIDDDEGFSILIKKELKKAGYHNLEVFNTGKNCIDNISKNPDIIFLDYTLDNEMNGLDVLKKIKEYNEDIYVIMLTAAERIELAIDSLRLGAYDYVIKNENAFVKIINRIKKIIKEKQFLEKSR